MARPVSTRKQTIASFHAIERYRQRIDPAASVRDAEAAVIKIVESGRLRKHVWWFPAANDRQLFSHVDYPGVCVVVAAGVAVTVVTRWARPVRPSAKPEIVRDRVRHAHLEPVAPFNPRNERQLIFAMGG